MENTDILQAYLNVADTFDAFISPEVVEHSMNNRSNEKTRNLIERILYLRMKAIADNANLLKRHKELEDEESEKEKKKKKYKPTKIQFMNYYLIELAAKCEKKEVKNMAAYAIFRLSLSQINIEINKRRGPLHIESEFVGKRKRDESILDKLNKDGEKEIYYSAHMAVYGKIQDLIFKEKNISYDHTKASPQTYISWYYKNIFVEELNPDKKREWVDTHNKVKKAENELIIQGIKSPTLEQITEYINRKSNAETKTTIEKIRKNESLFPTLQSIYIDNEDGNTDVIQISDSRMTPDQIVVENEIFREIEEVLSGLPYSYQTLGTIYLNHFFLGDEHIAVEKVRNEYIKTTNEKVSKSAIENALKELKVILKNALKLKKDNVYPFEWNPVEFKPSEEQMNQDEEDAFEAFCEEQSDGTKILKIVKKDKKKKDK